jgi:hypothetical protein
VLYTESVSSPFDSKFANLSVSNLAPSVVYVVTPALRCMTALQYKQCSNHLDCVANVAGGTAVVSGKLSLGRDRNDDVDESTLPTTTAHCHINNDTSFRLLSRPFQCARG